MINGTIGLIGNTYTIDCKMFSVATGAAEKMKNVSYQGEVDGLITEMEILAWDILDVSIPQKLVKKQQKVCFLHQYAIKIYIIDLSWNVNIST